MGPGIGSDAAGAGLVVSSSETGKTFVAFEGGDDSSSNRSG